MKKEVIKICESIRIIIEEARNNIYKAINNTMVQAYWQIGRKIVEEEQKGTKRAGYGTRLLKTLSSKLTAELGRGFDVTNLQRMRRLYLTYKIQATLSPELHQSKICQTQSNQTKKWQTLSAELL